MQAHLPGVTKANRSPNKKRTMSDVKDLEPLIRITEDSAEAEVRKQGLGTS
jgi:hypothetical protein